MWQYTGRESTDSGSQRKLDKDKRSQNQTMIRVYWVKPMAVEILNGYPCKSCGSWEFEVKKETTYYWVDFGIVLVGNISEYICSSCKSILIRVVEHKEEKHNLEKITKVVRTNIHYY